MSIPSASIEQIQELLQNITEAVGALVKSNGPNSQERDAAFKAAQNLSSALQNPVEAVFHHIFSGPEKACVRIAVDLGLFKAIVLRNGGTITATELAKISNAEELLIVRLMRVLANFNFVAEVNKQTYTETPLTKAITLTALEAACKHVFDHAGQVFSKLPSYLRERGHRCPTDQAEGPFQYALNTELSFFDYLNQDRDAALDFDTFMTMSRRNRAFWTTWYPVKELIFDGFVDGDVLIVDVGGGYGHDLEKFCQLFPGTYRAVLQDLPGTVEGAAVRDQIKVMAYNFFDPQPVKGARVYYFHHILHNWPDQQVREFLANIVTAMKPGYSKLIINDHILPEKGCALFPSFADFHMMVDYSAMERSEEQFKSLLESLGLEVKGFWIAPGRTDGLVEAVLPDV